MKFARIGERGQEEPFVIDATGSTFRVGPTGTDLDATFLAQGGIEATRRALEAGELEEVDVAGQRFGPPVSEPTLLVCIGMNYHQHVVETNAQVPTAVSYTHLTLPTICSV